MCDESISVTWEPVCELANGPLRRLILPVLLLMVLRRGESPWKVLVLSPVLSLFLAVRFWFSRGTMIGEARD